MQAEAIAPPRKVDHGYAERALYLVVAAVWAYAITVSLQPLGAGGTHSKRDLHHFLMPLLATSAVLVVCAMTSRATTAGFIARWVAIVAIAFAGVSTYPLLALFVAWLAATWLGVATATHELFLFLGGLAALLIALVALLKAVFTHRGMKG
jgi:hypothetical protein